MIWIILDGKGNNGIGFVVPKLKRPTRVILTESLSLRRAPNPSYNTAKRAVLLLPFFHSEQCLYEVQAVERCGPLYFSESTSIRACWGSWSLPPFTFPSQQAWVLVGEAGHFHTPSLRSGREEMEPTLTLCIL